MNVDLEVRFGDSIDGMSEWKDALNARPRQDIFEALLTILNHPQADRVRVQLGDTVAEYRLQKSGALSDG